MHALNSNKIFMKKNARKSINVWKGSGAVLYTLMSKRDSGPSLIFLARLVDIAIIYFVSVFISSSLYPTSITKDYVVELCYVLMPFIFFSIVAHFVNAESILGNKKYRLSLFCGAVIVAIVSVCFVIYNINKMDELSSSSAVSKNSVVPEKKPVPHEKMTKIENTRTKSSQTLAPEAVQKAMPEGLSIKLEDLDEETQSTIKLISQLNTLKKVQDWGSLINSYDNLDMKSKEILDILVGKAIVDDASLDVIVDLLSRGTEISGDHLSLLVVKRSLDDLKTLENYGLDITLFSSSNTNVYSHALLNTDRDRLFDYFVARQVPLENERGGDVLMDVMERSARYEFGPRYVELLVQQSGARITEEHRRTLESLKDSNFDFYQKLIPLFEQ